MSQIEDMPLSRQGARHGFHSFFKSPSTRFHQQRIEIALQSDIGTKLVAAESKAYARVEVMRLAVTALEDGLRRADVPVPKPV